MAAQRLLVLTTTFLPEHNEGETSMTSAYRLQRRSPPRDRAASSQRRKTQIAVASLVPCTGSCTHRESEHTGLLCQCALSQSEEVESSDLVCTHRRRPQSDLPIRPPPPLLSSSSGSGYAARRATNARAPRSRQRLAELERARELVLCEAKQRRRLDV